MIAILIPARMASTRFPGKPLSNILGKPMIQWVYEGIASSTLADFKAVLSDSKEIVDFVKKIGGEAFLVTGNFRSGTDRIAAFSRDKNFNYIVNVQGDEPLIESKEIDRLIEFSIKNNVNMATLVSNCTKEEVNDPNVVKVVTDIKGKALYFSRSPIPYPRKPFKHYKKHIGVYIYSLKTLMKLSEAPASMLESTEELEQLRALEMGIPIYTLHTDLNLVGVDKPQDIKMVENILKRRKHD